MYFFKSAHFISLLFVLFCLSCKQEQKEAIQPLQGIDSCYHFLQEGDIVLRAGKDELSNLFAHLSENNQTYSHAAVVIKDSGRLMLYHIVASSELLANHIRVESFASFTNKRQNKACSIIRFDMDSFQVKAFCNYILLKSRRHIKFDNSFDLESDDKQYCSELIYKGILAATKDANYIPKTFSISGKAYIAIDNLFEHKHAKIVCEIAY